MFKNKKGFTIVELVIVIAVIAILAVILIPTFSNVISDAQKSKDLQLARDIHVILQAERTSEDKVLTLEEAKAALAEEGIKRFNVRYKENALYWDPANGYMILYNYDDDRALYPNEYYGNIKTADWILVDGDADPNVPIDIIKNIYPKNEDILYLEGTNVDTTQVYRGDSYTLSIKFGYGYEDKYIVTHFSVLMGGKDITSSVVNNNDIYIPNVRGKIEINFYAIENMVLSSIDKDGTIFNNGKGYLENSYWSSSTAYPSSKTDGTTDGYFSTGYMPIPWEENQENINVYVYLGYGSLKQQTTGNYRYYFFDENKVLIGTDIIGFSYFNGYNYLKITLNKTEHSKYKYFAFSSFGKGENAIVSYNNPILFMDESTLIKSEVPVVVPPVYYDVILNGDVTLNGEFEAEEGSVYTAVITPPLGYKIKSVEIKMDGKILANSYHMNTIMVNGVNANIEINVITEQITFEEGENFSVNISSPNEKTDFGGKLTAAAGQGYTATLTAVEGATIDYVIVEMCDIVLISERPYTDTYIINIDKVYGDINITYMSTINKVETATTFNNLPMTEKGYVNGYYLSSGKTPSANAVDVTTGMIPIPWTENAEEITIYVYNKNGTAAIDKASHNRYCFFDGTNYATYYSGGITAEINSYEVLADNYVKFTLNKNNTNHGTYKSFAFSLVGKGEDLMVKFNEEINFYNVITSGDNITIEEEIAIEGLGYKTTVITELGREIKTIKVKMGNKEISNVFNFKTNTLEIAEISGNVEIYVETKEMSFDGLDPFNIVTDAANKNTILVGEKTVTAGGKYEATLEAADGMSIDFVTVKMGGITILSETPCSKTFDISIDVVSADVEIICSSSAVNKLSTATNYNSSVVTNGYTNNKRLTSEGHKHIDGTGYVATGSFNIPWRSDKQTVEIYIYIKDGTAIKSASDTNIRYFFYTGTEYLYFYGGKNTVNFDDDDYLVINDNYVKFTLNKTEHGNFVSFAFSVKGIGQNLIVQFNEEISEYDVYVTGNGVVTPETKPIEGLTYTTKLEAEDGYKINNVVAKINGKLIDSQYDAINQTLTIDNVYGNLEIVVETEELVFEEGTVFEVSFDNYGEPTTFNGNSNVEALSNYEATLVANIGIIENVVVYMGDKIVISEKPLCKEYTIQIDKVYDNIKIVCSSTTNVLKTAVSFDGSPFGEDGCGYKTGYISKEAKSGDYTGPDSSCVATGWINIPWADNEEEIVIYVYIKDGIANNDSNIANEHIRYYFYIGEIGTEQVKKPNNNLATADCFELVDGNDSYMKITLNKTKHSTYQHFRISVQGVGENLTISFNKPIEIE